MFWCIYTGVYLTDQPRLLPDATEMNEKAVFFNAVVIVGLYVHFYLHQGQTHCRRLVLVMLSTHLVVLLTVITRSDVLPVSL